MALLEALADNIGLTAGLSEALAAPTQLPAPSALPDKATTLATEPLTEREREVGHECAMPHQRTGCGCCARYPGLHWAVAPSGIRDAAARRVQIFLATYR